MPRRHGTARQHAGPAGCGQAAGHLGRSSCQALLDQSIDPAQRVRQAKTERVFRMTVGLPCCNDGRILPQYLLDHSARCNKVQSNTGSLLSSSFQCLRSSRLGQVSQRSGHTEYSWMGAPKIGARVNSGYLAGRFEISNRHANSNRRAQAGMPAPPGRTVRARIRSTCCGRKAVNPELPATDGNPRISYTRSESRANHEMRRSI